MKDNEGELMVCEVSPRRPLGTETQLEILATSYPEVK